VAGDTTVIHSRSLRIAGFCQSRVVSRLLLPADRSARAGSARRSGRVGRNSRRARLYAAGMLIPRSPRQTCKAWRTCSRRQHTRYGVSTRGRRPASPSFRTIKRLRARTRSSVTASNLFGRRSDADQTAHPGRAWRTYREMLLPCFSPGRRCRERSPLYWGSSHLTSNRRDGQPCPR